jgi:hypothetical protein
MSRLRTLVGGAVRHEDQVGVPAHVGQDRVVARAEPEARARTDVTGVIARGPPHREEPAAGHVVLRGLVHLDLADLAGQVVVAVHVHVDVVAADRQGDTRGTDGLAGLRARGMGQEHGAAQDRSLFMKVTTVPRASSASPSKVPRPLPWSTRETPSGELAGPGA